MCKYEIISVESSKCEWIALGEAAHQWEKHTYFLCKRAYRDNDNRPCDDAEKIAEPSNNVAAGSRSLHPCRVCEKYRAADNAKENAEKEASEAYSRAMKVAQDKYDAAIVEAKVKYEYVRSRSSRYDQDHTLTRSRYLHRGNLLWLSAKKIDLEGINIVAGIPEGTKSIMTTSPTMKDTTESTITHKDRTELSSRENLKS
jgi:hypothetical protein